MVCGSCKYNDGCTYTSLPPRCKCTITGEFHFGNDDCNVDFEPVRHGKWINRYYIFFECSECSFFAGAPYEYCPHCGAKMEM